MNIGREEFDRMYDDMKEGFRGVNTRLDVQNGRIGKSEVTIAQIQARQDVKTDGDLLGGNKQKLYALIGFATIGVAVEVAKLVLEAVVGTFVKGH